MRAALILPLVALGCGKPDFTHGRPEIEALSPPTQVDAYKLRFSIEFLDNDGDLGMGGSVHVVVNGAETNPLMLSDLFAAQMPPIALDASQGSFDVVVDLVPPIQDGEDVTIGFYLVDAKGLKSNVPDIVLQATMTGG